MPGRSRHAVVLGEEEPSELERRATRYTLPHKQVQRAKLVLYAAEKLTNVAIGARLEVNSKVVGRWRSRSARSGFRGLRTGRDRAARPVFPPEEVAQVKAVACKPPSEVAPLSSRSAADVQRLVIERGISDASASTIPLAQGGRDQALALLLLDLPHRSRRRSCSTSIPAASGAGSCTLASS
jgi:hypothetical protein